MDQSIIVNKTDTGCCGQFTAMASPCEVLIDSSDTTLASKLTQIAAEEAWRIQNKFSRYSDSNLIHKINTADGTAVELDEEFTELINFADQCFTLSEGLFDITSGVLREIWKFDGSDNIPSRKQAKTLLSQIGWKKVTWQAPFLTLPPGMQIDFGGFGKEYAVDCAAKLLMAHTNQPFLINFGGDLFANKAPSYQQAWQVGIEQAQSPSSNPSTSTKIISIISGGIATSGDAKRFLLKNGIRYPHILNPKTAWPVLKAPSSVTVIADNCTQAGFLATMAMLKGKSAKDFLDKQGVVFFIQE